MITLSFDEFREKLPNLIDDLSPGEEVIITRNDLPIARLTAEDAARKPRKAGNCIGVISIVAADDDDEHLRDFSEYMQ
jgi:antitoxin (DNA-binding transcriptional repressor) of toxin-antitoxin stability system